MSARKLDTPPSPLHHLGERSPPKDAKNLRQRGPGTLASSLYTDSTTLHTTPEEVWIDPVRTGNRYQAPAVCTVFSRLRLLQGLGTRTQWVSTASPGSTAAEPQEEGLRRIGNALLFVGICSGCWNLPVWFPRALRVSTHRQRNLPLFSLGIRCGVCLRVLLFKTITVGTNQEESNRNKIRTCN